jgi:hypothetical protein
MSGFRALAVGAVACVAAVLPVALAGAAPEAHVASACSASHMEVWLGDGEGGGTAGHTYYPIEFSNVGHSSCTLYGYPGVSAFGTNGAQVGLPASKSGASHSTVTIPAGGTAHALLAIADYGAICSTGANALGLKVYPPGQMQSQTFQFPLVVCASRVSMTTGPLRAGVGIPGYTNS